MIERQNRSESSIALSSENHKMKLLGFISLAVLGLISSLPPSSFGAVLEIPDEVIEDSEVYIVPLARERRSPQFALSGGGSEKAGTIRLDGQRNIYTNGRTGVDATGFAQKSWQQGFPSQNSYGAGATVNHNLWKGRNGDSLDAYAGYQRQWNTGSNHNAHAGLRYNFG